MTPHRRWTYNHWQRLPDDCIRHRLHHVVSERSPWWAWGPRVTALTGSDFGGNYQNPKPPTWWYRLGPPKRMAITGFRRHPLSTVEVITDYATFTALTQGLNEDQMYEWKAICINQDGVLHLGHQYWGGSFHGLVPCEVKLMRRYLRMWRRLDWYGLRTWLYLQGIHASVHRKRPFSCKATPAKGSGGYDHWHCQLKRRHTGSHSYNAMQWTEGGQVERLPARPQRAANAALRTGNEQ